MIGRLWRDNRLALIGFCMALTLVAFFAVRLVVQTIYWSNPAHIHQMPEGWMTPGYVERSWHMPPRALAGVLDITPGPGQRGRTLAEIAADQGIPLDELMARLNDHLSTGNRRAQDPDE